MKTSRNIDRNKRTRYLIALLAIIILATVVVLVSRLQSRDHAPTNKTTPPKSGPPAQASSEGTTFPVPNDLPSGAIQDYVLVTENEQYKIRRYGDTNRYTITLYAIINNPDQYSMYQDQLREYKQLALEYLKNKGVDTSQIEITYEPSEASNL